MLNNPNVQSLGFRNNLLKSINGNIIHVSLTELNLYGNQITEIRGLDALANLEVLNASFNDLKKIEGSSSTAFIGAIRNSHPQEDS